MDDSNAQLPVMLSFPPDKKDLTPKQYDNQIKHFIKQLGEIPVSTWAKPSSKQNLLTILNPSVNSIPYLYCLVHQIEAAGRDQERLSPLFSQATDFLTSCDAVQMRYVGEAWQNLFKLTLDAAYRDGCDDYVPFVTAILRVDASAGTFTSSHLRLVKSCFHSAVPSQAIPILDKTIYAYPHVSAKNVSDELWSEDHDLSSAYMTASSGLTSNAPQPEDVLEYYSLGARIYIGFHHYRRARLFLESILLSPSIQHAISIYQAEAYKKWVLLGLLAEGQAHPLPRTADQTVVKGVRSIAKAYDALAAAFEKRDAPKFLAEVSAGAAFWAEDGNARLVRDVADALVRYRISDLQDTYAALPVARVATHLALPPAETLQLLTDMIGQGRLNADVSSVGAEPVLHFRVRESGSAEPEGDLEAQKKRIADLVAYVRDADRRLQLTKEYVEQQKRVKRTGAMEGDLADAMDISWDAPMMPPSVDDDGDEDLMSSR